MVLEFVLLPPPRFHNLLALLWFQNYQVQELSPMEAFGGQIPAKARPPLNADRPTDYALPVAVPVLAPALALAALLLVDGMLARMVKP